jgi:hypothetical protein
MPAANHGVRPQLDTILFTLARIYFFRPYFYSRGFKIHLRPFLVRGGAVYPAVKTNYF